jgi:hypothetical protein
VPNVAGQNARLDRPIINPSELPSLLSEAWLLHNKVCFFPRFLRAESRILRAPYEF